MLSVRRDSEPNIALALEQEESLPASGQLWPHMQGHASPTVRQTSGYTKQSYRFLLSYSGDIITITGRCYAGLYWLMIQLHNPLVMRRPGSISC